MLRFALEKLKHNRTALFFVALTTAIIALLGMQTAQIQIKCVAMTLIWIGC